jgi:hypothetical protein
MKKINKITVKRIPDYDCDLSWIGTFNNEAKSDLAVKHNGGPREFSWFNPQKGACETKEQAEKDYQRMMDYERGNWSMIGIKAEAETAVDIGGGSWKLDQITSGGLWGIESDIGEKYLKEVETEQLEEVKSYLKEYGFSDSDINSAPVIYQE